MINKGNQVEEILDRYGIEVVSKANNEAICLCPFHPDKHPSFSINLTTGLGLCYAGCWKGNLISLVAKLEGISYREARKKIGRASLSSILNIRRKGSSGEEVKLGESPTMGEVMGQYFLEYPLLPIPPSLSNRLEKDTIFHFKLGEFKVSRGGRCPWWYLQILAPLYLHKLIIPIYLEDKVVAFQARGYGEERIFKNSPSEWGKRMKDCLFGVDEIGGSKEVILVEGPFDVMKNWERREFLPVPTVGIFGTSLSPSQVDLLVERGVSRLVLSLDNDLKDSQGKKAGQGGTFKILQEYGTVFDLKFMVLPKGMDPGDCSDGVYIKCFKKSLSWSRWKKRILRRDFFEELRKGESV